MKKIRIVVSLVALIFVLAACGQKKASGGKNGQAEEITMMVPEYGVPSDEILDHFEQETGIKVNIESVAWDDIREKVAVAAGGKTAPADLFEVDWAWVGEFHAAGWLEPVQIEQAEADDFGPISSFKVGDEVVALPWSNDFRLSYYNKKDFDAAGLKEPKTWEELYQAMKVIKAKGIKTYPYSLPFEAAEGSATALTFMTWLRDGKVFNEDNSLAKDEVLETLTFMKKALDDHLIDPANITSSAGDTYRQIAGGQASFVTGPSSYASRVFDPEESKVVGEVEAIIPPGKTGKTDRTMALPEGLGISAFSEHKEAAQKFLAYYTSKEVQEKMFEQNNNLPVRTSVLEKIIEEGKLEHADQLLATARLIASPYPNGVPAYYTEMSTAMFNAINKMALGELTPEEATNQIADKIDQLRQ